MKKLSSFVLKSLLCSGIGLFTGCAEKEHIQHPPLWVVDLAAADPKTPELGKIGPLSESAVKFASNARLIVGLLYQSLPDSRAGRHSGETVKSNAILMSLGTDTGATQGTKIWQPVPGQPASSEKLELIRATNGVFALVGEELIKFYPDLRQLSVRALPRNLRELRGYPRQDHWSVATSPDGKHTLLTRFEPLGGQENHWISPDTLKEVATPPPLDYSSRLMAVVDDFVVFNHTRDLGEGRPVVIARPGERPKELCADCIGAVSESFGANYVLLSTDPGASFRIVDKNGSLIYAAKLSPRDYSPLIASGASQANRVAMLYASREGGRSVTKVLVADADQKRIVWEETLETPVLRQGAVQTSRLPRLALSPDGKHLAVVSWTNVLMYSIP